METQHTISFDLIRRFSAEHPTIARSIIDSAIAQATNPDHIARLELAREYLTNPDFTTALTDYLAGLN